MNKRQKAIRDKLPGYIMSEAEWEYATDKYKELRKSRKMIKHYRDNDAAGTKPSI